MKNLRTVQRKYEKCSHMTARAYIIGTYMMGPCIPFSALWPFWREKDDKQCLLTRMGPSKASFRWFALKLAHSAKRDLERRRELLRRWNELEQKSYIDIVLFEQCLIMFHHQNIRAGDPCPKACFLCGKEYNGYAENPEEIIFGVKLD